MTLSIHDLNTILQNALPHQVTEHSAVRVELGQEWNNGIDAKSEPERPVDAYVSTQSARYQLSVGALTSLAGSLTMGRDMLFASPPNLVEPLLNHWLSSLPDEDGPSFTIDEHGVATAVVRTAGELPGLSVQYVRAIYSLLTELSDGDVRIHSWVRANTKETQVIFIIDALSVTVNDDTWRGGVGFTMSSSGMLVPSVYPVLVRDGGFEAIYPPSLDFRYKKSKHGSSLESTITWAEDSVGVLYTLLERELKVLPWLAGHDTAQHAGNIISDVLREVGLPRVVKSEVIEASVENDDSSGYGLLLDILSTQDFEEEDSALTEKIGRAAGKLWEVLGNRCDECHQMYH